MRETKARLMSLIDEVPSMDEDSLFQYLYSLRGSLEIPEDHSRFEDLIQQLGASRSLITTMATNVYRDERHDREIQLTALDVVENVEIALAPPHLRGAAVYTRFLVRDDILGDFWQRVRDRVIEAGWDLRGTLVVGCQEDDSETQRYILREPGGGLFVIGDSDSSGDPIGVELDPASPADIESVRDVLNDISRLQSAIPRS